MIKPILSCGLMGWLAVSGSALNAAPKGIGGQPPPRAPAPGMNQTPAIRLSAPPPVQNFHPPVPNPAPAPLRIGSPSPSLIIGIGFGNRFPLNTINIGVGMRPPAPLSPNNANRSNIAFSIGVNIPAISARFVASTVPPPTPAFAQQVIPVASTIPLQVPPNLLGAKSEYGLKIQEVIEGGAAKAADLRANDIIVGVNKLRVQTYEELRLALSIAGAEADIIFLNGENGKLERLPVKIEDGRIGVSVVPIKVR